MGLFIGVDCGSQGTKAMVVDGETGAVLGRGYEKYELIDGLPPGYREQHPYTWVDALVKTVRHALGENEIISSDVKCIAVSGQQHGFVPLDEHGGVIRPAKLWNDTSSIEECRWLVDKLGGIEEVVKLIGNAILPGFTAGKILWLKRHEPENYRRLAKVLLPHDFLNYWLTGRMTMEYGDASGTALMDIRTRRWRCEIIELIDQELDEKLPDIQPSSEPVGTLRKEAATKLSLSEDVLVSSGGGDNMMGAIGTGNTRLGIVTASLGTSGTVYSYSDKPVVDPIGEAHAFCDSTGGWLPLACTMNVTVATEVARELLGYSHTDIERALDETMVGSDGLLLLPYLTGERTPNVPNGSGVLFGITPENFKAPQITRAFVEGATMGLNYGLNRLRLMGVKPTEVRLTGGGSKNRAWRRIAADVFGVPIVCLEVDEGAAYGAALQALWVYGHTIGEDTPISKITEEFVKLDEDTRAEPDSSNVKAYGCLQAFQDKFSLDLRDAFDQII